MGNRKNKKNPNANRGKYCKKQVPAPVKPARTTSEITPTRIIINITPARTINNITTARTIGDTIPAGTISEITTARTISEIKTTTGNRIINLHSLKIYFQEVTNHVATCQACISKALQEKEAVVLFGEAIPAGFASVLCSRCAGCQQEFKFSTSTKVKRMSGDKQWETNLAAVWGRMTTGGGHKALAEMMTILGVPVMTKQSFLPLKKR